MEITFGIAIFLAITVSVHGYCISDEQCERQDHVKCLDNYQRHCVAGRCTCTQVPVRGYCSSDDQCDRQVHFRCPDNNFEYIRHCVSGRCTCTQVGSKCLDFDDCEQENCGQSHCIDNLCRCGLYHYRPQFGDRGN